MKLRITRFEIALASLVLLMLATGCAEPEYKDIEIVRITNPPDPATAEFSTEGPNSMSIGFSVAISLKPESGNRKNYTVADSLELFSKDEDKLAVSPSSIPGVFVLTSLGLGSTCMDLHINGKSKDCIDVEIVD